MKFCPRCGCELNEHTPMNVVREWREKAKKYDGLSKDFPVTIVEKDAMLVNIGYFDQIKEKAQKWDECGSGAIMTTKERLERLEKKAQKWDDFHRVNSDQKIVTRSYLEEQEDKAKKWDELTLEAGISADSMIQHYRYMTEKAKKWDKYADTISTNDYIEKAEKWDEHNCNLFNNELKEKAQKWDRVGRDVWEKAKKWDSFSSDIIILGPDSTAQIAEIHEWKEKAQKWDDVCSNNHPTKTLLLTERYLEYKEKAQKWDAHQKIWETDLHISKDRLNELEEKARKYDEIASYSSYYTKIEKIKEIIED